VTVEEPIAYLVARLHEALLSDERLHEQAIEILAAGEQVELRGEVATPERREAAVELVRRLVPDKDVVDGLTVSAVPGPDCRPEHL
jgi:osmotically-inducible protein OsmY